MKHSDTYVLKTSFSRLFIFSLLLCTTYASIHAQGDPPFNVTPTNASGVLYGQVEVNGFIASDNDWIAAFDPEGNCAGATRLILNEGLHISTWRFMEMIRQRLIWMKELVDQKHSCCGCT